MPKKYIFTEEQKTEIEAARKANRKKEVEKRLLALSLRSSELTAKEIAERTDFHPAYITLLVSKYRKGGIKAITANHYPGNRRNMSFEEESELLSVFLEDARAGKMVDVAQIKKVYEEAAGHSIGSGQIYFVLHRHGWRKVMPRSRHPKKACWEATEASKKLTKKFNI